MPRDDHLLRGMRKAGIDDPKLRKSPRNQEIFSVLRSLGIENPRAQLGQFIRDEIKGSMRDPNIPATVSFGPYTETRTLGFLNRSKYRLVLDDEDIYGSGTIASRQKNGNNTTIPVALEPGDLYEVQVNHSSGRVYVSYDVDAKAQSSGAL